MKEKIYEHYEEKHHVLHVRNNFINEASTLKMHCSSWVAKKTMKMFPHLSPLGNSIAANCGVSGEVVLHSECQVGAVPGDLLECGFKVVCLWPVLKGGHAVANHSFHLTVALLLHVWEGCHVHDEPFKEGWDCVSACKQDAVEGALQVEEARLSIEAAIIQIWEILLFRLGKLTRLSYKHFPRLHATYELYVRETQMLTTQSIQYGNYPLALNSSKF